MRSAPTPTVFHVGRAHRGWRLDRFLQERIPRLSRSEVQRAIRQRVSLDRLERPVPATRLQSGDQVVVGFPELAEDLEALSRLDVRVLHEDDEILAVDKPPGIVVHPTNRVRAGSLLALLQDRHPAGAALRLAHRLDRETSGVVLLAKGPDAARRLHRAFAGRRVRKEYLAVVVGEIWAEAGVLDFPLASDRTSRLGPKQQVSAEEGARAVTRFRVLRRVPGYTLVELAPLTGRQHQIRVHLRQVGHPVVGDKLYGPDERFHLDSVRGDLDAAALARLETHRHLLHASALHLTHPSTGNPLSIHAPLPTDFTGFLDLNG